MEGSKAIRAPGRDSVRDTIALSVVITAICAPVVFYFYAPVFYGRLSIEDSWGEFTAFAAMLASSILFYLCFRGARGDHGRFWYLLLALATFFVAMEEISWGQRMLRLQTPELMERINLQGETNLHNISWLFPHSTSYTVAAIGSIFFGAVLPGVAYLSGSVRSLLETLQLPIPRLLFAPLFIAAGYFIGFSFFYNAAEIGETLLALALCAMAVDHALTLVDKPHRKSRLVQSFIILVGVAVAVAGLGASFLLTPLVAQAYRGEGFLGGLISGQGERPLGYYVDLAQNMAWSGLALVLTAALLWLAFSRYRPPALLSRVSAALRRLAVPSYLLGSFAIGICLTNIFGSVPTFQTRLTSIAEGEFADLGMHRQSARIAEYLEAVGARPGPQLDSIRGNAYLFLGREEEGRNLLAGANAAYEAELGANPTQTSILNALARNYSRLGERDVAWTYWQRSLDQLESDLGRLNIPERQAAVHVARAQVFEEAGAWNDSVSEYVRAFSLTEIGERQTTAERGIARSLQGCRPNDRINRVKADEVRRMVERLAVAGERTVEWCSLPRSG